VKDSESRGKREWRTPPGRFKTQEKKKVIEGLRPRADRKRNASFAPGRRFGLTVTRRPSDPDKKKRWIGGVHWDTGVGPDREGASAAGRKKGKIQTGAGLVHVFSKKKGRDEEFQN